MSPIHQTLEGGGSVVETKGQLFEVEMSSIGYVIAFITQYFYPLLNFY